MWCDVSIESDKSGCWSIYDQMHGCWRWGLSLAEMVEIERRNAMVQNEDDNDKETTETIE